MIFEYWSSFFARSFITNSQCMYIYSDRVDDDHDAENDDDGGS